MLAQNLLVECRGSQHVLQQGRELKPRQAAVLKLSGVCSTLWLIFIIQGVAALVFTGYTVTKPVAKREHYCAPYQALA